MEIGILGPLEVTEAGLPVPVGGSKRRALLTLLTVNVGNVVTADALVEELWGDEQPREVANALQTQVSQLRKLLPSGALVSRAPGYVLDVDPTVVDAVRFERLVADGRKALANGDMTNASTTMQQALSLWRGPALVDCLDIPAARAEATRLEELRQSAFEARVEAELALGHHGEVIADLQTTLDEHPFHEGLRAQLMIALYRSGRQADALAVYQDGRRRFADEFGLDPGPELQQLESAILRQDPGLNAPPPQPVAHGGARASADLPTIDEATSIDARLPTPLTTFVGREDALEELAAQLASHRLVTVTGPGGTGKTRLVLEFAARQHIADGAWFIDLTVVTDPADVPAAAGHTFGVGASDAVGYLAGRAPLVIVDNCEHVLDGAAAFVATLLRGAPDVRVIATSREPLNVDGELQLPLPPLPLDDAVRLFEDRAAAVSPGFVAGDEGGVVADVCERLDGLPLAIELAAARAKALPVADIATRLDNRFRLLTTGSRTAVPRHQTLRALVDWSYDLLFDDQRQLFEHLSVFVGGIALDAAESITEQLGLDRAETVDLIGALVDKSLLVRIPHATPARYRMLETLREYARDRLEARGELDLARRRHATWCLALAEEADGRVNGPEMAAWLDRLVDLELDNVRAAIAWALDAGEAWLAGRVAVAYGRPMWERGHQREGRAWLEASLALPASSSFTPFEQVQVLQWLSSISSDHDRPFARQAADRALEVATSSGDESLISAACALAAQARIDDGELDDVDNLLERAAAGSTGWAVGWCEEIACYAALRRGRIDEAEQRCLKSLETFDALQHPWSRGRMRHRLAFIAELRGDYESAAKTYEESIAFARELAVHEITAVRLAHLARVSELIGDATRAASCIDEANALLRWLAGSDSSGPMARRRSDLALARGEMNDVLVWYEAVGEEAGAAFVRERLDRLRELIGD